MCIYISKKLIVKIYIHCEHLFFISCHQIDRNIFVPYDLAIGSALLSKKRHNGKVTTGR